MSGDSNFSGSFCGSFFGTPIIPNYIPHKMTDEGFEAYCVKLAGYYKNSFLVEGSDEPFEDIVQRVSDNMLEQVREDLKDVNAASHEDLPEDMSGDEKKMGPDEIQMRNLEKRSEWEWGITCTAEEFALKWGEGVPHVKDLHESGTMCDRKGPNGSNEP